MSYIIINGTDSRTITGLLIQNLPPITKPLVRTQIEEIDGRDGDVAVKLGYSAYDKELSVGLYGSFDIDEVIAFFDSEGTIIFSNEPDKEYSFAVYEQIDFERLVRFRTATVTLHMQPFKYKAGEEPEELSGGSIDPENEGNIYARPTLSITGTGTIGVNLNGAQIFQIVMGTATDIVIDCNEMNAYDPDTGAFMNRAVTGDYNAFRLAPGTNEITFTGTVSAASVSRYSRWI